MKIEVSNIKKKIVVADNLNNYDIGIDENNIATKFPPKIIDARYYGFLPTATSAENVAAWNNMPSGVVIIISMEGTYEVNNTIFLRSNTKYIFKAGITIKKDISGGDYCHIFANEGMADNSRDENIYLYGNNLIIDIDGSNDTDGIVLGTRANIQIYRVDGFLIHGIYSNNPQETGQFFISTIDCHDGYIDGVDITSEKDGLVIIGCSNLNISNLTLSTRDDYFFLGLGYATNTPIIKDTENITIENVTFNVHTGVANCFNIWAGSWTDWLNGYSYIWNEFCINDGKIYGKTNTGSQVATVAPVHTSGDVTGADGITWRFIQYGNINHASVRNITIKDITINDDKCVGRFSNQVVSTGTEGISIIDNITFDGITFKNNFAYWIFIHHGQVGNLAIKNADCNIYWPGGANVGFMSTILKDGPSTLEKLTIENCELDISQGIFLNLLHDPDYSFESINIIGSKITYTGKILLNPYYNILDDTIINLTNTEFIGLDMLLKPTITPVDIKLILDGCIFSGSINYICYNEYDNSSIIYESIDTTYISPVQYLFYNKKSTSLLSIDISDSSGLINWSKIYQLYVTLIALDIVEAPEFVIADAGGVNLITLMIDFDAPFDETSVPSTSAFSIAGKTVVGVSIDGYSIILTTVENFINTDVITVSYDKPSNNKLRGYWGHQNVESFSLQPVLNVTDNLLNNGNFVNGTVNWNMVLGGAMNVTEGIAKFDKNGTSYCIFDNTQYGGAIDTYIVRLRVIENIYNASVVIGWLKAGLVIDVSQTFNAISVGVHEATLTNTLAAISFYFRAYLNALPENIKIGWIHLSI